MLGLLTLAGFVIWIVVRLIRDIRRDPDAQLTEVRYGLLFFSALWPVWLWYSTAWTMRVPMLAYWFLLGYVLAQPLAARQSSQNALQLSVQGA